MMRLVDRNSCTRLQIENYAIGGRLSQRRSSPHACEINSLIPSGARMHMRRRASEVQDLVLAHVYRYVRGGNLTVKQGSSCTRPKFTSPRLFSRGARIHRARGNIIQGLSTVRGATSLVTRVRRPDVRGWRRLRAPGPRARASAHLTAERRAASCPPA